MMNLMNKDNVKYPCRGCVYYDECGESTRTMYCAGRMTKSQRKKATHTKKSGVKS